MATIETINKALEVLKNHSEKSGLVVDDGGLHASCH